MVTSSRRSGPSLIPADRRAASARLSAAACTCSAVCGPIPGTSCSRYRVASSTSVTVANPAFSSAPTRSRPPVTSLSRSTGTEPSRSRAASSRSGASARCTAATAAVWSDSSARAASSSDRPSRSTLFGSSAMPLPSPPADMMPARPGTVCASPNP
ncbi:hypothetical protein [Actinomadura hallensis]|uniref:hypothetical protein n=1 Tax=Actinomadura hallensis TaxID=337895 RepID=UPI001FECF366|nr:hypothetical protein [Actinomadura hallensis]